MVVYGRSERPRKGTDRGIHGPCGVEVAAGTPRKPVRRLDGKWLSQRFQEEIKVVVAREKGQQGRAPGLGVILVGDNPASHAYVANKERIAKACGFKTSEVRLPATCSRASLLEAIHAFNADTSIDGILLQLPLPPGLNQDEFLDAIDPKKDADGLHPVNQGLLVRGGGVLRPCTPLGIMHLIDLAFSEVDIGDPSFLPSQLSRTNLSGKRAVVIGRSILVGKPVGLLLLERNATVTYSHSKTADIASVVREADIVVAAVGLPRFVQGNWVKPGAVVIDVGINRVASGGLVGDVDFDAVEPIASAITPVPGGVGPMTVAMLMHNTLQSYLNAKANE